MINQVEVSLSAARGSIALASIGTSRGLAGRTIDNDDTRLCPMIRVLMSVIIPFPFHASTWNLTP